MRGAMNLKLLPMLFAVLMVDFFDTLGTATAIGEQAGLVDGEGRVEGIGRVLEDLWRRAGLLDASLVHDDNAVGNLEQLIQILADQEHGAEAIPQLETALLQYSDSHRHVVEGTEPLAVVGKRMMQAGEDYIKSSLQTRTSFVVARPSSRRGPVAV